MRERHVTSIFTIPQDWMAPRRELDTKEQADLDRAMNRAWANLPRDYQWLKQWAYV